MHWRVQQRMAKVRLQTFEWPTMELGQVRRICLLHCWWGVVSWMDQRSRTDRNWSCMAVCRKPEVQPTQSMNARPPASPWKRSKRPQQWAPQNSEACLSFVQEQTSDVAIASWDCPCCLWFSSPRIHSASVRTTDASTQTAQTPEIIIQGDRRD